MASASHVVSCVEHVLFCYALLVYLPLAGRTALDLSQVIGFRAGLIRRSSMHSQLNAMHHQNFHK